MNIYYISFQINAMFFVGIFSNIIPVIVLCVVSLGFYISGGDLNVAVTENVFDLTQNYELKFEVNSNSIDSEKESNLDSAYLEQSFFIEKHIAEFYDEPIIDLLTQQIAINSYRGSPILS